jgi:hypothetical protein
MISSSIPLNPLFKGGKALNKLQYKNISFNFQSDLKNNKYPNENISFR